MMITGAIETFATCDLYRFFGHNFHYNFQIFQEFAE